MSNDRIVVKLMVSMSDIMSETLKNDTHMTATSRSYRRSVRNDMNYEGWLTQSKPVHTRPQWRKTEHPLGSQLGYIWQKRAESSKAPKTMGLKRP